MRGQAVIDLLPVTMWRHRAYDGTRVVRQRIRCVCVGGGGFVPLNTFIAGTDIGLDVYIQLLYWHVQYILQIHNIQIHCLIMYPAPQPFAW